MNFRVGKTITFRIQIPPAPPEIIPIQTDGDFFFSLKLCALVTNKFLAIGKEIL